MLVYQRVNNHSFFFWNPTSLGPRFPGQPHLHFGALRDMVPETTNWLDIQCLSLLPWKMEVTLSLVSRSSPGWCQADARLRHSKLKSWQFPTFMGLKIETFLQIPGWSHMFGQIQLMNCIILLVLSPFQSVKNPTNQPMLAGRALLEQNSANYNHYIYNIYIYSLYIMYIFIIYNVYIHYI